MYRILVPLDGSQFAEQALARAARLAAPDNTKLKLLHVVDFVHVAPAATDPDEEWLHATAQSDAGFYLEQVAHDLKARFCIAAETAVAVGLSHEQIQQEARTWKADLIVMATHGRGAYDRAWLGSVADTLVRESTTPVLLVHPQDHQTESEPAPLQHILVTLDGSSLAEQILTHVERLALLSGARVTLLRAIRPWVVATRPMASAPQLAAMRMRAVADRKRAAREYLSRTASALSAQLVNVNIDVVVCDSNEANDIMRYAENNGVDLIALATRGRSGVRRFLLGSVADKLIRGASLPVLVQRPV